MSVFCWPSIIFDSSYHKMAIAAPVITFPSKAEAEGQCHLDRSGPFYQESRSSSAFIRKAEVLTELQESLEKQETGSLGKTQTSLDLPLGADHTVSF